MTAGVRHSVSVAAVIVRDDGRVLMARRRDNGKWEPPGGVLELGETVIDGLRREVREETGLVVESDALTGVYKNMPRGIIALVFRAHIVGGTPATTTAETTKLTWPTLNEVGSYSDEAYAVRVLDAFAPSGTTFRSHDGVSVLDDPISFLSSLEAQLVLVMIWDYMRSSLINRRCCAKSWFPGAYLGVPPAGSDNACEDWVHAGADPGQGGIEVVQIRGGAVLRASAR